MKHILNDKYIKNDLKAIAERSTNIYLQERNDLYTLLKHYESLFDVNLGTWNDKTYDIKFIPYA